jgi:hypothetical protein
MKRLTGLFAAVSFFRPFKGPFLHRLLTTNPPAYFVVPGAGQTVIELAPIAAPATDNAVLRYGTPTFLHP